MLRVLVIDDEEAVLKATTRRLAREGFEVASASTADEGIALLTSVDEPFDVIVTDMSMEDPHSGLRVLTAAFSRDLFAEVIVMTAYGNVTNAVECMRRGAFDYIEKNSPEGDVYELLVEKIDKAMDRRRNDISAVQRWERAARAQEARKV